MDANTETAEWLANEMREIRRRVALVPNLRVSDVLQSAGISYSTWWRWEQYVEGNEGGQVARMPSLALVKSKLAEFEAEHQANPTQ